MAKRTKRGRRGGRITPKGTRPLGKGSGVERKRDDCCDSCKPRAERRSS